MKPNFLKISKIIEENDHIKTFYFDYPLNAEPGQFIMLWVPGIDQKPFSIGFQDKNSFGLTIFKRGPLTKKLFDLKVGDRIGISGPYGTSFAVNPDLHYILVAGGYGAAPLGFLAEALSCHPEWTEGSEKIDFLIGARNKDLLLFEERLSKIPNINLHIATDDGSKGHHGYVTDILQEILKPIQNNDKPHTLIATCGPELMEKKILDMSNKYGIECAVSIERYMKCGIGICGQCAVDGPGICMCKEGPVVKKEIANQITEFGKYHRNKSGQIVNL